ncbi:hypothetical protein SESBI_32373 [Sesbania bispinosa]|nr:hypothetical protein SESBI_32373 [Sesbania bispinosa]
MSAVPLSSPRRCAPCLSSLRSMSVIAASPSNLPIARRRCSSRAGGFSLSLIGE